MLLLVAGLESGQGGPRRSPGGASVRFEILKGEAPSSPLVLRVLLNPPRMQSAEVRRGSGDAVVTAGSKQRLGNAIIRGADA
jgi:hypothetical protein